MEDTVKLLMRMLRCGVSGEYDLQINKGELSDERLKQLYSIAKKHDLTHLVGFVLRKNGLLDEQTEIGKKFAQEIKMAYYRHVKMQYDFENICKILNDAKITYIPLKGAVIRPLYPEPWLRTSCDIDILVKEKDLKSACKALESSGLKKGKMEFHDVSFYSESGTHLELHFNLNELDKDLDKVLNTAWENIQPTEEIKKKFSNEFFVFHLMGHMACHFRQGGCGIKTILDLWLVLQKVDVNQEVLESFLSKANILKFYKNIVVLTKVWFENQEHTEQTLAMQKYIFSGGVYGTKSNKVAVSMTKKSGVNHVISRLFPPYLIMKSFYPILEKHKILLPFYWIARPFKLIFRKGKARSAINEINATKSVTKEQVDETAKMLEELGLN